MDKQEQYLNRVLKNLKGETVIDVRVDIDNERVIHFKYPFQDEIKVRPINGILPPHISKVWGDDRPDIKYLYRDFLNHCMNVYGLTKEEFDNFIKPKYNNWLFNTMREIPMFEDGIPLYTNNINWATLTVID